MKAEYIFDIAIITVLIAGAIAIFWPARKQVYLLEPKDEEAGLSGVNIAIVEARYASGSSPHFDYSDHRNPLKWPDPAPGG